VTKCHPKFSLDQNPQYNILLKTNCGNGDNAKHGASDEDYYIGAEESVARLGRWEVFWEK